MTITIEQPHLGVEVEAKQLPVSPRELVLDGVFIVPETNAFGQTFRDYAAESERKESVEEFYRMQHTYQTYDFVKKMREEYGKLNKAEMSIWECCELLNNFVDASDPDLDEPQIEHLLQTAEAIRKDYPNDDWLHLTALIHDLGKVLFHPSFGQLPQWAVVGDTFPVGCAFDDSNVHHQYFKENPDYQNPKYNTKCGVYSAGCGLDNVLMSWGHDDYMYMVAKENKTTLPSAGMFIIRYHSFYPLHRAGAYRHLMNEEDSENLKWLNIFNKYDLYSKSKDRIDVEKVKPYYLSLVEKFFKENPDYENPKYNTKCGVYSEGCGLDNVLTSWGPDDYMYMATKENKTTLSLAGLFIIRYHSFYPLHRVGAYRHLTNEEDSENLKWLNIFNKYDLYSKSKERIDVEKVKPYYLSLVAKY